VEALRVRGITAELGLFLDRPTVVKLGSGGPGGITTPTMGLDAKQVVTAAAVVLMNDRATPAGLQRSLGHQVAGIDAQASSSAFGHGQHGGDEFFWRIEAVRHARRLAIEAHATGIAGTVITASGRMPTQIHQRL